MNCGSLLEFATNRTFQLRQVVDTFLSPESTAAMEHASAHYLTDYVLSKHVDSKFLLHRVELLSQRISERFTGRRRILQRLGSRRRAMQEESVQNVVDLDVTVAFRGFVLELSLATIELYVLEGIQSAGFISALQYTNDPAFQEVNVSLDVDDGRIDLSPESEPDTNETIGEPTRVIVLVLTLILLGAVAVAVLLYAKLRRIDSMAAAAAQPDIIDLDSQVVSPAVSTRSGLANVLSCDSFLRCISTQASPKSFVHEDSSTEHSSVMASEFESGRDSPSRESRASGTVEHPLTTSTADEHPLISSTADEHPLITSTTDEHQFTTSSDDEHPLTGVIPQMIVYDCIDDDENIKKEVDKVDRPQCVVPSRHMAATAQFRAALQDHSREAIDESTFVGIRNFEASKTDFAFDDTCFAGAPHHASGNSVDAIDSRRNHQTNTDSKGPSYQVISSIELNPTLDEDGAVSDATTVRIGAGGRSTPELSLSVSFKGGTDAHENLPRTRRKSSAHMRRSRSSDRITDKDRRDMLPFESFRKEKDARSERKGAASDEDPKKMFQVPASYHRLSFSRSSIRSTTSSPVPPLSPPPSPPAIRSSTSMTTILMRPIGTPPRQARKAYQ